MPSLENGQFHLRLSVDEGFTGGKSLETYEREDNPADDLIEDLGAAIARGLRATVGCPELVIAHAVCNTSPALRSEAFDAFVEAAEALIEFDKSEIAKGIEEIKARARK